MNIKITLSRIQDYYKNGKLKKNAKTEGFMLADVREISKEVKDKFIKETAQKIKEYGYHNFSSPYVFTHINALNENNEPIRIDETVGQFMTSPKTLLEALTN